MTTPVRAAPSVKVAPTTVSAGQPITITGAGFGSNQAVSIGIGPPQSEADEIATVRTDGSGSFRLRRTIPARLPAGPWVILACRSECRVKATANLRVTRPAAARETGCGTVRAARGGATLRLVALRTTCTVARRVIATYHARFRRGHCKARPNTCPLTVRSYRCATRTSAASQASGIVTTCTRGARVIRTRNR
ncbi:MAG: hypothetical protein Q8O56_14600 [Solirubrobacteraceae bacterium]|nr:hypothetical protein [Solirubrobacteraceae bacterium]